MKNSAFMSYHPFVQLCYFGLVCGFSMFVMHPVCLAVSLISGIAHMAVIAGMGKALRTVGVLMPFVVLTALINPAFNHEGATIITYLPEGNPLTWESVLFGLCAAVMALSVICHFSCLTKVFTSDRIMYLFGTVASSLSLVISMTLSFVPRLSDRLRAVAELQRCTSDTKPKKLSVMRQKIGAVSSVMSWVLETSVDTADSMKARGFGCTVRSHYSLFRFERRDAFALALLLAAGVYCVIGIMGGEAEFLCFPSVVIGRIDVYSISVFAVYALLCMMPVTAEATEVRKWKYIR